MSAAHDQPRTVLAGLVLASCVGGRWLERYAAGQAARLSPDVRAPVRPRLVQGIDLQGVGFR